MTALLSIRDRYDSSREARVRAQVVKGNYYISQRQASDACRRACILTGSYLVCDPGVVIYVFGKDNRVMGIIEG